MQWNRKTILAKIIIIPENTANLTLVTIDHNSAGGMYLSVCVCVEGGRPRKLFVFSKQLKETTNCLKKKNKITQAGYDLPFQAGFVLCSLLVKEIKKDEHCSTSLSLPLLYLFYNRGFQERA